MNLKFPDIIGAFVGWNTKRDISKVPPGTPVDGQNTSITDGDQIAPRAGSTIFGAASSATTPITNTYTFRKRSGLEIPMRCYGTAVEYYHAGSAAWENLVSGATSGARWGFAAHNINTDQLDLVYFCNAYEPFQRWTGEYTQLNGALAGGGETTITVDSTLTSDVFYSGTVSSSTATTIVISPGTWGSNIWNNFQVRVTSGANANKVRNITATTSTQITFVSMTGGCSAGDTFEIRRTKFPIAGDTLRIGHTTPYTLAYSDIPTDTTITTSANSTAVADDAAVTINPTTYTTAPRCNQYVAMQTRLFGIGNLASPSSIYYSKIADATAWTFSSPRVANEGGVIDMPEGGGPIVSLVVNEDELYALKRALIKKVSFTQDANDLPEVTPLYGSYQIGSISPLGCSQVRNDLFFPSSKGGIKRIQRQRYIGNVVLPDDASDPIRPTTNASDFSSAASAYFDDKWYCAAKRDSTSTYNDVVYVYNVIKDAWELPIVGWNVGAWFIYGDNLYYGSSINPETYQASVGNDENGNNILARWVSGDHNYGAPGNHKSFNALYLEGYISDNTTLTVKCRFGYKGVAKTVSTTIAGTDANIILDSPENNVLGIQALALWPLASPSSAPANLKRFKVYLTTGDLPFYEHSLVFESEGVGQQWIITGYGANLIPKESIDSKLTKQFA